ncbi:MAG: hypothetical protein EHM72_16920 [Calditrichaeota bacterium]|nr:MAG: hypothetical protein EHM72_16920 [Calditrichota bacterium]
MKKVAVLGVLLVAVSCTRSKAPMEPQVIGGTGEEYAVYRVVLNDLRGEPVQMQVFVMPDSTENYIISDSDYVVKGMPQVNEELIAQYNQANTAIKFLQPISGLALKCYLVNRTEIPAIFELKTKFPDAQALVSISSVGFDAEKRSALVYISCIWAPLAGWGKVVYLEKEKEWQIKASMLVWIS